MGGQAELRKPDVLLSAARSVCAPSLALRDDRFDAGSRELYLRSGFSTWDYCGPADIAAALVAVAGVVMVMTVFGSGGSSQSHRSTCRPITVAKGQVFQANLGPALPATRRDGSLRPLSCDASRGEETGAFQNVILKGKSSERW